MDRRSPFHIWAFAILVIAVALTLALVAYGFAELSGVTARVSRDEARTCSIQQKGLPAGHALASVISDLHFLVALPQTPRAKRGLSQYPPDLQRAIVERYHDLGTQAALYAQLEGHTPATRKC